MDRTKLYEPHTDAIEAAEHIELCGLKGDKLIAWIEACLRVAYASGKCDSDLEYKKLLLIAGRE